MLKKKNTFLSKKCYLNATSKAKVKQVNCDRFYFKWKKKNTRQQKNHHNMKVWEDSEVAVTTATANTTTCLSSLQRRQAGKKEKNKEIKQKTNKSR